MVNGVLTIPLPGKTASTKVPPLEPRGMPEPALAEFVAGIENRLAATAVLPLLDANQDRADTASADANERTAARCNPLVFYGPHGSGKSHLAVGIADWWRERQPHARVQYYTGAEFARQYSQALGDGTIEQWRDELRSLDLFILEDLGELSGKQAAQQELIHTLDALADGEARVVITARSLPSHWKVLLTGLRSRLSAALAVPLVFPARATRRIILARLAASRNLPLARRALDGLADGLSGSVPMLAAAIWELELAARLDGEAIDPARVRKLVIRRDEDTTPKLREIARLTARHYGLKLAELKSPDRRRPLVVARCVAMYLARQLTSCSLGEIGDFFGGRDHTTVLHGCRRTEELLRHDSSVRQAVTEVRKMLVSA